MPIYDGVAERLQDVQTAREAIERGEAANLIQTLVPESLVALRKLNAWGPQQWVQQLQMLPLAVADQVALVRAVQCIEPEIRRFLGPWLLQPQIQQFLGLGDDKE